MEKSLELGSEYRTKDGGGLAFKVVSDGQVVCTERAEHWSGWFEVGGLYSLEDNGNIMPTNWEKPSAWSCFPWITLRPGGKIFT